MYKIVLMVLFNGVISVCGQLCLKVSMNKVGRIGMNELHGWNVLFAKILSMPLIWVGLALYAVGAVVWLIILSRVNLSVAYPLLSINFVLVILASWFFLGEPLTSQRIVAIAIICCGIIALK